MKLLQDGHGIRQTARMVGASPSSVVRWRDAYKKDGQKALASKPPPSRPCKLSDKQLLKLQKLLLKGPKANGYKTELWTLQRIAQLIKKQFGQSYQLSGVWYVLFRMGWSCQKPEKRARERDEQAITDWRKKDWPRIKKSP
ncbi:MAG: winged helix-turn-helix domain-containing protein [Sedimentisphaerales bacterium]|nr:winged helix-turn-helix domain-containing protein [Sedimentisphaerales bacterium]